MTASTLLLAALAAASGPTAAEVPPAPSLRAEPLAAGDDLRLDGRLDEPAWRRARWGAGFVERVPYPGTPAAVDTRFAVLFDRDHLWVGVRAAIAPGERPRALNLTRDSFAIFDDDALSLKFDVRGDRRTTLGFVTNPAGAELDYVGVENGLGGLRRELDAVWEVETTVTATAWTAEFRLPAAALGLPDTGGPRAVGLEVTRDHNARLATYDWAPIPAEFGALSALHYGRLEGLDGVASGTPLTLVPFALATHRPGAGAPWTLGAGGDLRLRLGGDIWAEATLLTDFAQVDLDAPVINLDRFPIFLPERRPFFLAGVEMFEAGAPGLAQLFFSRRIGLDPDGRVVPVLGGARAYGSSGELRFGLLEVVTDDARSVDAASWSVARVRRNLGERGHLGALGTLVVDLPGLTARPGATAALRHALGVDAALRSEDRRLEATAFYATTGGDRGERTGHAGQAILRWRSDEASPELALTLISPDFDPAAGFVARRDLLQARASLAAQRRPRERFGLQRVGLRAWGMVERALSRDLHLGQRFQGSIDLQWQNGVGLWLGAGVVEDRVVDPFEVVPGRTVAPGRYRGPNAGASLSTPSRRNPSASLEWTFNGALFGGQVHTARLSGSVSVGALLSVRAAGNLSRISLPGRAPEETFTVDGGLALTPSTRLVIDALGQVNAFSRRADVLGRLRWRYHPGSDLFLVYREALRWAPGEAGERSVTLKIAHRFDALL